MKPGSSANLREIASWQLAPFGASNSLRVNLPKLQRGFVWKPAQIINLWDSLLRGFPIGSLLLSKIGDKDANDKSADEFWLLDGQQRATSVAMGFYDPWKGDAPLADPTGKQGWSLKVIPVLWIDALPRNVNDEKLFFPYLVTQSHPWGYNQSGGVLPWGMRRDALKEFASGKNDIPYTSLALKDAFPWGATLPLPMAFLIDCAHEGLAGDQSYLKSLTVRCQALPKAWHTRFKQKWAELSATGLRELREATLSLDDYPVHLNYLDVRARGNDRVDAHDNSILFVRLNTGGKVLTGEDLIFSLYKSAFPAAKDAVEKAAAGFVPPSRLFSLFARLVKADGDPTKLHEPFLLRDFKTKIADSNFRNRLEAFIDNRVAKIARKARNLMIDGRYGLPAPLATRTIGEAPDVFLALLFWLDRNDGDIGNEDPRYLLAAITALSWFGGSANQKKQNLRQWMTAAHKAQEFWKPIALQCLFTRKENPLPSFPPPAALESFLETAIANDPSYTSQTLGAHYPDHEIYSCYSHIPEPNDSCGDSEVRSTEQSLRKTALQQNLRSFLGILRGNKNMLLFAQRDFLKREFREFQQWDVVLEDTHSPWDWDHIYPSAHGRRRVDASYKVWHDTIGNKRAEELSSNRANGAALPGDKLEDPRTRKDAFISDEFWEMSKTLSKKITDSAAANALCRMILKRMAAIYREWHTTLGIDQLMAFPNLEGVPVETSSEDLGAANSEIDRSA